MTGKLDRHPALEVRHSPIHGYGVFALERIHSGELIEECRAIALNKPIEQVYDPLDSYVYEWPRGGSDTAVVFGYASLFNHNEAPNADWTTDEDRMVVAFRATRDIEPGEEILINYGEDYWQMHAERGKDSRQ